MATEKHSGTGDRPPTLQAVADAAGLSTASVSLALRGRAGVSAKTRERVRDIAEELGYRPSPALAALVARRDRSASRADTAAALITSDSLPSEETACTGIRAELDPAASSLGFRIKAFQVTDPDDYGPLLSTLYHQGVTAIILHRASWGPTAEDHRWSDFSIVHCQPLRNRLPFHTVRSAIYRKSVEIARKMELRGYRRVGQVVMVHDEKLDHPDDSSRLAAALEGCYRHKGEWPDPLVLRFDAPFHSQLREIESYVRSNHCDSLVAAFVGQANAALDLPPPSGAKSDRLGVAVILGRRDSDHLAGMHDNARLVAEQSASLLDHQVRGNIQGLPPVPVDVVVPSVWNEGSSLPDLTVE